MQKTIKVEKKEKDKSFLVGVYSRERSGGWNIESSLEELAALAKTAGADVMGTMDQKLNHPSPLFYIGKGKLDELLSLKETAG